MSFDDILALIQQKSAGLETKLSNTEDTAVNFHIAGSFQGIIGVEIRNGKLSFGTVPLMQPDAEITASTDDIPLLLTGQLNPMKAVLSGRIKISGNVGKLLRVVSSLK